MSWHSVVFLVEVALVLAAAAGWVWVTVRANRLAVRQRVLVSLIDGQAMNGVLYARRGRYLVLRDVTLHAPGNEPTRMDGEVLLDRDRVDFIQVLGAG